MLELESEFMKGSGSISIRDNILLLDFFLFSRSKALVLLLLLCFVYVKSPIV